MHQDKIGEEGELLFRFGIISDLQYADREDGYNYTRTARRHYRGTLSGLGKALTSWSRFSSSRVPFFILQVGDLVDGFAKDAGGTDSALKKVLSMIEEYMEGVQVHHCIGNHELYNKPKCEWLPRLEYGPSKDLAEQYLTINKNEDKNSPLGLNGLNQRFVAYNGAIGTDQLRWLKQMLVEAERRKQHVILFGHIPIYPGASPSECLLWNYDQVLQVLHQHAGIIKLYIAGHTHSAALAQDEKGIWHYTSDTPLEKDAPYSTAFVYDGRKQIEGCGANPQLSIPLGA